MNLSLYIKAYDACIVEFIGFVCGVVQIVIKMQMLYVFLMVLVLRGNDIVVGQVVAYDFFYLVQQWPRSYCNTGKATCIATKIPKYFTIHGLWAQLKNGQPVHCTPRPPLQSDFDPKKVLYVSLSKIIQVIVIINIIIYVFHVFSCVFIFYCAAKWIYSRFAQILAGPK